MYDEINKIKEDIENLCIKYKITSFEVDTAIDMSRNAIGEVSIDAVIPLIKIKM